MSSPGFLLMPQGLEQDNMTSGTPNSLWIFEKPRFGRMESVSSTNRQSQSGPMVYPSSLLSSCNWSISCVFRLFTEICLRFLFTVAWREIIKITLKVSLFWSKITVEKNHAGNKSIMWFSQYRRKFFFSWFIIVLAPSKLHPNGDYKFNFTNIYLNNARNGCS